MQRISSRSTFFTKRVFPVIWFGFLAVFVLMAFSKGFAGGVPTAFLLWLLFMAVFGYFIMKKLVFDLADEVLDAGDALIVRVGSEQERIPLSEIINVSYSYMQNPNRVTLTSRALRQGGLLHSANQVSSLCQKPHRRRPDRAYRRCPSCLTPYRRSRFERAIQFERTFPPPIRRELLLR
jgi:hypothetical protein